MENRETDKKIPIDKEINAFHQYVEKNDRCILSAKFGDGKTYFLSKFAEKYSDYLIITIHPANYQIANNYDIFDYIKRDILLNLLMISDIEIDDTTISKSWMLYSYFKTNKFENLSDLAGFIPDINIGMINISLKSFFDNLDKIREKFKDYQVTMQSNYETAHSFIQKYNAKGIYEFDYISQLICDIIEKYKEEKSKKVVLIIEDLDRIDPAHIFRILNIFSAQMDRMNTTYEEKRKTHGNNKFCFDKIVTVCDFDNIEKIYHHLYGDETDFTGYINKFYTDKEFNYSLTEKLTQYIIDNLVDSDLRKYGEVCRVLISYIVKNRSNIDSKYNSIRSIITNFTKVGHRIRNERIPVNNTNLYYSSINPLTKLLELLKRFNIKYEDYIGNKETNEEFGSELTELSGVNYLYLYGEYITGEKDNMINLNSSGYVTNIQFERDNNLISNIDAFDLYNNDHINKKDEMEGINYFKQFIY